jgi:uncharacterized caspase-like protein
MAKVALLIGVSEYNIGLDPLPAAVKDVEAMSRVLKAPSLGGFDDVKQLTNPDVQEMQYEIEHLFSSSTKDDLVVLFFSGHGIKDDAGKLFFATRITSKNSNGDLIQSTAAPASFVLEIMNKSRSRRQVVILDCCFSGAFDSTLRAKHDGSVDLQRELGAEGRVVLTSSSSTQYSFEQHGSDLSIYTRYLIEGIETGAGDQDRDGNISIVELHKYASEKVREKAPSMTPKIITLKDLGFDIVLAKAKITNPAQNNRHTNLSEQKITQEKQRKGYSMPKQSTLKQEIIFLYPQQSNQLKQTVISAVDTIKSQSRNFNLTTHNQDITSGSFLSDGILQNIDDANIVFVDITEPNFNILFAVGYALGKNKKIALFLNSSLSSERKEINEVGSFDSLEFRQYENSRELESQLMDIENLQPLRSLTDDIDKSSPIYVLDTFHKTDAAIRVISKIKKAKIRFRSFDPKEQSRLSILEAIKEVKRSIAVVINLLSSNSKENSVSNLRGAFLSGLAYSCDKILLILQEGQSPLPANYQDIVKVYNQASDVDRYINELAPQVMDALQEISNKSSLNRPAQSLLEKIELGALAAENEMGAIATYYVSTDSSKKTITGGARIVVGRKGTGKTALFLHVRDYLRKDKKNTILDLKPEGHQLQSLKGLVLNFLVDAVQEHVATAFWEYLLLLEICHKLLQKDKINHTRDARLYELYRKLQNIYEEENLDEEIDFSERMYQLVKKISNEFKNRYDDNKDKIQYLMSQEVTQLIYKHDVPKLTSLLAEYLSYKGEVWILFDNIDKGWPTRGVTETDIVILRALLEAARKIEKALHRKDVDCYSVVFIRNDVFELLVDQSSDRGKELKVSLDWNDRDLLKELLRLRLIHDILPNETLFDDVWGQVSITHINGELTIDYLIERSLMRPRNLLSLVNYAKGNAINLRHTRITEEDIKKAVDTYSADIGNEIGLEIRDVFPSAEDILYSFIGVKRKFSLKDLKTYLRSTKIDEKDESRIIEILFWFAFLGVTRKKDGDEKDSYIYDVFYDMKKLKQLAHLNEVMEEDSVTLCIHPAFWPFLEI